MNSDPKIEGLMIEVQNAMEKHRDLIPREVAIEIYNRAYEAVSRALYEKPDLYKIEPFVPGMNQINPNTGMPYIIGRSDGADE